MPLLLTHQSSSPGRAAGEAASMDARYPQVLFVEAQLILQALLNKPRTTRAQVTESHERLNRSHLIGLLMSHIVHLHIW